MAYVPGNVGAQFNGLFDDLANLIPSNTIVGKAARGDWSGALSATANYAKTGISGGAKPSIQPQPSGGPGLFAPGGFIAQNQTVLLLGAAGLLVVLMTMRKGRR